MGFFDTRRQLQDRIAELEIRLQAQTAANQRLLKHSDEQDKYIKDLRQRWMNAESGRISAESKINYYQKTSQQEVFRNPFSQDEIRQLINLCHPDKHGGKDSATKITQKLLQLRA